MNKEKDPKKFSWRKELAQWGAILLVGATLYATGLHTEVIGKLQSVVLYTGIFQPDVEDEYPAAFNRANYNLNLIPFNDENITLERFRGKTIFLNIWATWCPPCIAEMPNIQKLYDSVNSDNITFVMLSLDEDPSKAKDFIARKAFTFPVYTLGSAIPRVFSSPVVPTTFVVSPDGRIVLKHEGMAKYNTDEFRAFLTGLSDQ